MKKILSLCCLSIITNAMHNNTLLPMTPNQVKNMYFGIQDPTAQFEQDETLLSKDLAKHVMDNAPDKINDITNCLLNDELLDSQKPQRIILAGPPGTGKTTLALAMMTTLAYKGWQYKLLEGPFIADQFRNSGPQNLQDSIEPLIKSKSKAIIALDEISCLLDEDKNKDEQVAKTITAFWLLMDRCAKTERIFFVGTTNDVSKLSCQITSRFNPRLIINVPLPTLEQRQEMISYYLNKNCYQCDDIKLLAKKTYKKSYRDIEDMIMGAIQACPHNKNLSLEKIIEIMNEQKGLSTFKLVRDKSYNFLKNNFHYILTVGGMMLSIYLAKNQINNSRTMQLESQEFQKKFSEKLVEIQQNKNLEMQQQNQEFQKQQVEIQKNENNSWTAWGKWGLSIVGGTVLKYAIEIALKTPVPDPSPKS